MSWNPITGYKAMCYYCWARRLALTRLKRHPHYAKYGFEPAFNERMLRRRFKPGSIVFTVDMGDMWGCYDEETEILTLNGWKKFKEVTYDDYIACLNPQNNRVEYHRPARIIKYYYEGRMVRIKTARIDLLVTPDHYLYVSLRTTTHKERKMGKEWQPFKLVRACEALDKRMKFRRDFPNWEGREPKQIMGFLTELWLKFLGYYLSEGSASIIKGKPRIQIAQLKKSPHYKEMKEVVEK